MEKKYRRGTTGSNSTDQIIDNLYTAINEVVDTLNSTSGKQVPNNPEGSLRVVKQSNDTYIVAVKSADGWLVSDASSPTEFPTGFRFQTKLD